MLTASRNASRIQLSGYRPSASFSSSAISGVTGLMFCSYNAKMPELLVFEAGGSGSSSRKGRGGSCSRGLLVGGGVSKKNPASPPPGFVAGGGGGAPPDAE